MITHYMLVFSLEVTVRAENGASGTLLLGVCLHLTTKELSFAIVWAVQFDVQTPFGISGGKVLLTLTDLEHCLAAMLSVGVVHLELHGFSPGLLHEHVSDACAAAVRTSVAL